MARGKKCHRPGPVTKSPFLNFLREYRKKHCGLTVTQMAKKAAKEWYCLTYAQRQRYACMKPTPGSKCGKRKRKSGCGKKKIRRRC